MPVSIGAGRMVMSTRAPVCRPTPVDLTAALSVRCLSIDMESGVGGAARRAKARRVRDLASYRSIRTARARAKIAERHGLDRAAAAQVLYAARRDSDALRRGARPPEDAPCLFAPSIRLLAQERRDLGCVER